jgi:acetyltransferase-like isoleucine patch superfamily enzyme
MGRASDGVSGRLSILVRDLWTNGVVAWPVWPRALRLAGYRLWGMEVEARSIAPGCFFGSPRVRIGAGTRINRGCFFDGLGTIEIGRDCGIGLQVFLCTSTHPDGGPGRRRGRPVGRDIRIGDGCWIGARALVLPGVTIGAGCVIGAGSVVTSDCAPNGLYAGVPARRLRDLPEALAA